MRHRRSDGLVAWAVVLSSVLAVLPAIGAEYEPVVEDLGGGHYRVGAIAVDVNSQSFTVSGRVEPGDQPLKSLSVAGAGFTIFESLMEFDANAYEFNRACTLLGLASSGGNLVDIQVSWEIEGVTTTEDACDLVLHGTDTLPHDGWLYTGSTYTPDGAIHAHLDGTLVGIIQDPVAIFAHGAGYGPADHGALAPNTSLLPPDGTPVTVTIGRRAP